MSARPDLTAIIGDVYEAAYASSHWTVVMERLRALFDGTHACLARLDSDPRLAGTVGGNIDPDMSRIYVERHWTDIVTQSIQSAALGEVVLPLVSIGRDQFQRSAAVNEWLIPQDMYSSLTTKLFAKADTVWFLDISRSPRQADLDDSDAGVLRQIVPHLIRAGEITKRVRADVVSLSYSHLPYAALMVDREQRIVVSNARAEKMLADRTSPITASFGRLVIHPLHAQAVTEQIANACADFERIRRGKDLCLPATNAEGSAHIVQVAPLPRSERYGMPMEQLASVFIHEISAAPEPDVFEQLRRIFKLTPAEAHLAELLARGIALQEAAQTLQLTLATARTYLDRIFRKTDTNRQGQLVALINNLAMPWPPARTDA